MALPKGFPKLPPDGLKFLDDADARIGFAEGLARKGEVEGAKRLAEVPGPVKDRIDACLAAGAVLIAKDKDNAKWFVAKVLDYAKEKGATLNDWQILQFIKLAARTEDRDVVKGYVVAMSPQFQSRAHLEIFLALCEKSSGPLDPDKLADIEGADVPDKKAPSNKQDPHVGVTLSLGWLALARHNARMGFTREANRKMFEDHVTRVPQMVDVEMLRPVVDVGTYQGMRK